MSKKRKNAGEGYGYMFSGAFKSKADAVKKERTRKGSFVKGVYTQQGHRYVVMTPRTNPRRNATSRAWSAFTKAEQRELKRLGFRKSGFKTDADVQTAKAALERMEHIRRGSNPYEPSVECKVCHALVAKSALHKGACGNCRELLKKKNPVFYDAGIKKFTAHRFDQRFGNIYASGFTKKEALKNLRDRLREYRHGAPLSPSRGYGENPTELMVMAANPHEREITVPQGTTITIRTNPAAVNPDRYTSAHARAAGHARTRGGLIETPLQRRLAKMLRKASGSEGAQISRAYKRHKVSGGPSRAASKVFHELYSPNPAICGYSIGGYPCTRKPGHRGPHLPQGATMRPKSRLRSAWKPRTKNPSAAALHEEFTGKAGKWLDVYDEPHMPAGDYAQLGELLALYFKPAGGGQVQQITFPRGGRPVLVGAENARQIYFVGGDQGLAFPSGPLGECRRIDYKQRKEHVPDPELDEWRHEFGEESGIRPTLCYDAVSQRLLLEGGDYRIRAEGIVN